MTLQSMTGFAQKAGQIANNASMETTYAIELRSVNGKSLEIRMRLPSPLESLDQDIRKHIASKLKRGHVTLNITLKKQDQQGAIELNKAAFKNILKAAEEASSISGLPMPTLDALLNNRTVLQEKDLLEDEKAIKEFQDQIMQDAKEAVSCLLKARLEEGTNLKSVLEGHLQQIATLVKQVKDQTKNQSDDLKQKIQENIKSLLEQNEELNEDRLHQEVVLLSVKADISEEIDRLMAHIEQAHDLLNSKDPVGRRLDFLCQEFNREANTICSKAYSKEITYLGLELKTVIDQLREQVQNIE